MIHVRTEGGALPQGISFYHWKRRHLYVGFRLRIGSHQWHFLWLPPLQKFDLGHFRGAHEDRA